MSMPMKSALASRTRCATRAVFPVPTSITYIVCNCSGTPLLWAFSEEESPDEEPLKVKSQ
jgi:hypothetical protein